MTRTYALPHSVEKPPQSPDWLTWLLDPAGLCCAFSLPDDADPSSHFGPWWVSVTLSFQPTPTHYKIDPPRETRLLVKIQRADHRGDLSITQVYSVVWEIGGPDNKRCAGYGSV